MLTTRVPIFILLIVFAVVGAAVGILLLGLGIKKQSSLFLILAVGCLILPSLISICVAILIATSF